MAKQKFEVGQTVRVQWLNLSTTGKVRSYDKNANGYYVWIPSIKEEIYYTSSKLEAWN